MNKNESKYFNTSIKMNKALISILDKKDFEFISVKEICDEAKVNRSTFYLHYDNTSDLLEETIENISKDFYSRFNKSEYEKTDINHKSIEELIMITPKYLRPYLEFVYENKKLFKLMYKKNTTFNGESMYLEWFNDVFKPILNRFNVKEHEQSYVMTFYLQGIIGLITEWLKNDCAISLDELIKIINLCIRIPENYNDFGGNIIL